MVELTLGGAWFKWSSLGARDRRLVIVSLASAGLAGVPLAMLAGEMGYDAGFRLGSGGLEPPPSFFDTVIASEFFSWLVAASIVFVVISAVAWWRFSVHQDELFNRIQNYAIGQGASRTLATAFLCWSLAFGGWIDPLPIGGLLIIGTLLVCAFWFQAVRRWA